MGQPIRPLGIKREDAMSPKRLKWIISGLDWDKLDERELKFVESCEERMDRVGELTEPMERWLNGIYRNKGR